MYSLSQTSFYIIQHSSDSNTEEFRIQKKKHVLKFAFIAIYITFGSSFNVYVGLINNLHRSKLSLDVRSSSYIVRLP